jgi:hypothetical protein
MRACALLVASLGACPPAPVSEQPPVVAIDVEPAGSALVQLEPEDDPPRRSCDPEDGTLRGGCLELVDSRWELTSHMPEGTRVFVIDLNRGGKLVSHDPHDTTDDDEWDANGEELRFWFNQRYVVFEAIVVDPDAVSGDTLNINGVRWAWRATRLPGK